MYPWQWTRNEILALIKLYERYPALYDTKHPNYNERFARDRIFILIHDQIKKIRPDVTLNEIKLKIQVILTQYRREAKLKYKNQSYKPKLWFFKDADFLYSHVICNNNKSVKANLNNEEINNLIKENLQLECSDEVYLEESSNVNDDDDDDGDDNNIPEEISTESENPSSKSIIQEASISQNNISLSHNNSEFNTLDLEVKKLSLLNKIKQMNFNSITKYEAFSIHICKELENIKLEHNFNEIQSKIKTYIKYMIEKDQTERNENKLSYNCKIINNNDLESKLRLFIRNFPKSLTEFGYDFNDDGILCKINIKGDFLLNENIKDNIMNMHPKIYEMFTELITRYIYDLIEAYDLNRIYIPNNIPIEHATFIFCTHNALKNSKKLLILINSNIDNVKAGQWNRNLIYYNSLNHGSKIPYIERAKELQYDILITNSNDNYRKIKGKIKRIPDNETSLKHCLNVWENYIIKSKPKAVCIIAHGYGGFITIEMVDKFSKFFKNNIFGIVLMESVHLINNLNYDMQNLIKNYTRHYVSSSKPLDEQLQSLEIPKYSAGHKNSEFVPYACMSAAFDFLEKRYEDFLIVEE